jgi:hypothetical protein
MELVVSLGNDSVSIPIDNPFLLDQELLMGKLREFLLFHGAGLDGLDIQGLIPMMIRGIAGCERGCPADAKGLVSRGFEKFELQYIEGGILSAKAVASTGDFLILKMFPDF